MHPGMRSKDDTDAKSQVPIPRGEDVQFREKHRKFEHLDWKAEQVEWGNRFLAFFLVRRQS